ncbi:MAG: DUF2079 domain-containing protein [Candidatus Hadarchaeum sp.]
MRRFFHDPKNWRVSTWVLLAGYALGLFIWQITHRPLLSDYLYENQLSVAQRVGLIAWLVTGVICAVIVWFLVIMLIVRNSRTVASNPVSATTRLAVVTALCRLLLALPFLPLLALPDIEKDASVLVLIMVIANSALAAGSIKAALALWRGSPEAPLLLDADRTSLNPYSLSITHRLPIIGFVLVLFMTVAYALFMSLVTVGRHNAFGTNAFDLGIHVQSLFTIAQYGYPAVTLYGPEVVNQFSDHFAPIFYLLIPLYLPWGDARALLVLQSVALASGAIPVYLLARLKLTSHVLSLALAISYLLFPALHGVNNFDFHEIALVTPLLLWSFLFLESGRFRLFGLFLILALMTKEEVALTGIAIGLYILFVQSQVRKGALVALGCAVYFVLVVKLIMPLLGGGADIGRFDEMEAAGFEGFTGVAITILTNPAFTLDYALINSDKLFFLMQLLLPVLGIPFLAGLGSWIVAMPGLATLLLSSYRAQYLLDTHYSAIVIPSIFFLTVLGLGKVERRCQAMAPLAAALLVASLLMNWQFGWLGGKLFQGIPRPDRRDQAIASLMKAIPPDASVSTLSKLVPHLANRKQIYLYPTVAEAEYILFDSALEADFFPMISRDPRGEAIERLLPFIVSGEYGLLRVEEGVLLLQRGYDPADNQRALAVLGSVTYDAVAMFGAPSMQQIEDPATRSGQARLSPALADFPKDPLTVVSGPYATVIPGRYRVDFRLRLAEPLVANGLVAIIDVFSYAAGGLLAQHGISAEEFVMRDAAALNNESNITRKGLYHTFSLEFEIDQLLNDVEFRVFHTGLGALAIDTIAITYLAPPTQ